ncbi:MAG: Fic family protein [Steroidobacteraceae bacterium]
MIYQTPALPDEFLDVIANIDKLRQQLNYTLQQSPHRWTGLLARSVMARAIQGSNSIEGYNFSVDDAIAAVEGEEPLDAELKDRLELFGYRDAMSYVLQLARDKHYTHNEGTTRSLHYMMLKHDLTKNPGRWRPGQIWVKREETGETVYEGPEVLEVPGLMNELIASLNLQSDVPVMVRAAMAHLNLTMIHPFSDGNGRMARALQTFVLAREGVVDPRFSSIEEYLGGARQAYYDVLAEVGRGAWHPENNPLPWIRFCLTAHYQQAELFLHRTSMLDRLWYKIETEVDAKGMKHRYIFAMADAAVGFKVRNATYRRLIKDLSDQMASRDLHELSELGYLKPIGERRGRYYLAGDWLRKVAREANVPRRITDPFVSGPRLELARHEPIQKQLL